MFGRWHALLQPVIGHAVSTLVFSLGCLLCSMCGGCSTAFLAVGRVEYLRPETLNWLCPPCAHALEQQPHDRLFIRRFLPFFTTTPLCQSSDTHINTRRSDLCCVLQAVVAPTADSDVHGVEERTHHLTPS